MLIFIIFLTTNQEKGILTQVLLHWSSYNIATFLTLMISILEHLQQSRQIFACLESEQYILLFAYPLFQIHFSTLSISFSISFKYYFFLHYLLFF